MSKDAINQYDATAANNTDVGGISIDEGMLPSNVNNALREIMSHLKDVDAGTSSLTSPVISGNMTVTGDLTVDTNTLFVDSTNNNVLVGGTTFDNGGLSSNANGINVFDATAPIVNVVETTGNTSFFLGKTASDCFIATADAQPIRFHTDDAERVRIDSSGNLLVGKTSDTSATSTVGHLLGSDGVAVHTRSGAASLRLGRTSSDGEILSFHKDGTTVGSIDSIGGDMQIGTGDVGFSFNDGNNAILPYNPATQSNVDNFVGLGLSSHRYDDAFITNVTTGSDQNEKQQIASLTDAEIAAAKRISNGFKTFKWNSAVTAKGDNARTHTGVIAQEVRTALEAEGLNAGNYALWCSDTWWETQTEVPAVEADEENGIEAKDAYTRTDIYNTADEAPEGATERTRLGIRYPELLAFVGAATEQRLADIETRLTTLENT
jgi:hypothetical protein